MEKTPVLKDSLVFLYGTLSSQVYNILKVSSAIPYMVQNLMRAPKQSAWYPSWFWGLPSLWLHSTGAILMARTFVVILFPASLSLETNSDLSSEAWPWSVPFDTLLTFPGLVVSGLRLERHISGPLAIPPQCISSWGYWESFIIP